MSYTKSAAFIGEDYEEDGKLAIMLPHSCDEWVIGNADDARNLISDLEKLIVKFEDTGDSR